MVGNRAPDEAAAIRFQASARGVAGKSLGLNHPKNYLAHPLAAYHPESTADVLAEHVVRAVDDPRTGAALLDLIAGKPAGVEVTPLGEDVIRFAVQRCGSVDDALAAFEDWQRSRQRFADIAPEWGLVTRRVVWSYPATQLIVNELQTIHEDGITSPSLVGLVEWLDVHHPRSPSNSSSAELTTHAVAPSTLTANSVRRRSLTVTCTTHRPCSN